MKEIKIKLVHGGKLPQYKTEGAACADCYARIPNDGSFEIPCGRRTTIPLGFALELPQGYEAVIRPRSGLSKNYIDEVIGTIDCDYRGEVCAILVNNGYVPFIVKDGDRICQLKIQQAEKFSFVEVETLDKTERGYGGFGSTGISDES